MQTDKRHVALAVGAAVAFLLAAVLNLVGFLAAHQRFQLWSAAGFAVVSLLWFLVSVQWARVAR